MASNNPDDHLPLSGLCVVDFSTLAPGPLATLMLAEAGAEVIKIERPGEGEDLRRFAPLRCRWLWRYPRCAPLYQ